jgi:molybdopterin converting factor subunit 1
LKTIIVKYFASLREMTLKEQEELTTNQPDCEKLYLELKQKYDFILPYDQVEVAINDEFVAKDTPIEDGDTLVFIPPVAGG